MSKFADPVPPVRHECPKCHQVLQPLSNGIPHYCETCVCGHSFPKPRPGFTGRAMIFCPKCGKSK